MNVHQVPPRDTQWGWGGHQCPQAAEERGAQHLAWSQPVGGLGSDAPTCLLQLKSLTLLLPLQDPHPPLPLLFLQFFPKALYWVFSSPPPWIFSSKNRSFCGLYFPTSNSQASFCCPDPKPQLQVLPFPPFRRMPPHGWAADPAT